MKTKIRLTESELINLVRNVIKEGENEAFLAQANTDLQEVGLPNISLDDLESDNVPEQFISQIKSSDIKPNQENEKKSKILEQIRSAICTASETELPKAKQQIKNIIKDRFSIRKTLKNMFGKKDSSQAPVNEQVELAAATTILGVTAPLWIWVAIGAIVLILILRRLFRRNEETVGCRGETWRQVLQRINPDGNY